MAYASTSSPFANVKGPSIFSSNKPSPWAIASTSAAPMAISSPTPVLGSSAVPGSPPRESSLKRTGFEAFASSSSPFASAAKRPKSPTPAVFGNRSKSPARHRSPARVNAFSAYATGGAHAFATPVPKRSGSGSPALGEGSGEAGPSALNPLGGGATENDSQEEGESEKGVSFGERLRASKDEDEESEEKKLNLTEQESKCLYPAYSYDSSPPVSVYGRGRRGDRIPSAREVVRPQPPKSVEGAWHGSAAAECPAGRWYRCSSAYVVYPHAVALVSLIFP